MEPPENLDLTAIEARLKYPAIAEKFEALRPGHALVINNNDDSRSLYDQLIAERGQTLLWEALENGPEKWRIKIMKNPGNSDEETIGKIISRDYRKSRALNSFDIDFSSGGNRTLGQAFEGKEQFIADVLLQWKTIDQLAPEKGMNFLSWDMAFLTRYIIQLHHKFVSTQTRFVTELALKVADSNSSRNPEIKKVADLFAHTGKMLEIKGQQEEKTLFPYIIALFEKSTGGTTLKAADFGQVSVPISLIQIESERVVADLRQIRKLTNNYVAPAYSSSTCPILYKLLAAYEEDAHLHLHLENNILFPNALKTENSMRSKNQIT
jgi:regulator of cell morphogenesis and NO signaling